MLRIVAMILVGVQALLPPGMCLCRFVPPVPHRQELRAAPAPAHTDDSCCSCPACRPAQTETPPSDERAAPDLEAPHEHRPLPAPAAPCSGCPVVDAGPAARAVILDAPERATLATAAHFVAPAVEVVPSRADRPHFITPVAPPLFVRHCALLI